MTNIPVGNVDPNDPNIDTLPGVKEVNLTPTSWFREEVRQSITDVNSRVRQAIRDASPIQRINGAEPDAWGNVTVPPGDVTPLQIQRTLLQTFHEGDNTHLEVNPVTGQIKIHAHNIGSVWTVNGECGHVTLTKASFGLDRVDNTSDMEKPISNSTRLALNQLQQELLALLEKTRATLDARITSVYNTLNTSITSAVSSLNARIDGKADKNHRHAATDIDGLDSRIAAISINNWGAWTPLPKLNGWSGTAMAVTNGREVVLRGHIYPGSNVTFGRLPFGFPVSSAGNSSVGYGSHTTKDAVTNQQRRITVVTETNGVLTLNGYAAALDGQILDGCRLLVL